MKIWPGVVILRNCPVSLCLLHIQLILIIFASEVPADPESAKEPLSAKTERLSRLRARLRARSPCVALFPTALSLAHQLRRDRARSKRDGRTTRLVLFICAEHERRTTCAVENLGEQLCEPYQASSSLLPFNTIEIISIRFFSIPFFYQE